MKKFLSILAAVGLTATASTAVVSCTSVNKLLSNLTVDNGAVSFKVNGLKVDKDIDANKLTDKYAVFVNDNDKKAVDGFNLTPKDSSVTKLKKNKKYDLTGSFTIADYSEYNSYSFIFGTKDKNGKLDSNLGTLTIVGATKPKTPTVTYSVSGSFETTLKSAADKDKLKDLFVIPGVDNKNVTYTWKDESKPQTRLAQDADESLKGTVEFSYTTSEKPTVNDGGTIDIELSSAATKEGYTEAPKATVKVKENDSNVSSTEFTADAITKAKNYDNLFKNGRKPGEDGTKEWTDFNMDAQAKMWAQFSDNVKSAIETNTGIKSDATNMGIWFYDGQESSKPFDKISKWRSGQTVDASKDVPAAALNFFNIDKDGKENLDSAKTNKFKFVFWATDGNQSKLKVMVMDVTIKPAK